MQSKTGLNDLGSLQQSYLIYASHIPTIQIKETILEESSDQRTICKIDNLDKISESKAARSISHLHYITYIHSLEVSFFRKPTHCIT